MNTVVRNYDFNMISTIMVKYVKVGVALSTEPRKTVGEKFLSGNIRKQQDSRTHRYVHYAYQNKEPGYVLSCRYCDILPSFYIVSFL